MSSPQPVHVGTHVAYFATAPRGRLTRLTPRTDARLTDHPWPPGTEVEVRVNVFEQTGRLYVGGVEVSTVPREYSEPWQMTPPPVAALPVASELWRAIPIGTLGAEALSEVSTDWFAAQALTEDALRRLSGADADESSRGRGRRPTLTPALLRIVAQAHSTGGRRSIEAVRQALSGAPDFHGAGPDGSCTQDQAKKAIARARREGYLPQAR